MPDAPNDAPEPVLETRLAAPPLPPPAPALRAGRVLSRTLRVWASHVVAFTAMSVVVYAPMLAAFVHLWSGFQAAGRGGALDPSAVARQIAILFAAAGVTIVLSVVQMGAVAYGTVQWLNGERASAGRMLRVGLRRGVPVVGTGFVVWLVTVAGMVLLLVPGILFLVAASVAVPAAVVERPGIGGALRRSFELTRGSRWPLFAAGLAVMLAMWLLSTAFQLVAALIVFVLPPGQAFAVTLLVSQLGNVLFSVLPVVAVAVCYHDLRLAKEGVDTAELARVFE